MASSRETKLELLSVSNLKTRLGCGPNAARAVDGVSFTIHKGETYSLLGESGCGKSMTALSLMRLLPPSGRIEEGSVVFDGCDLLKLSELEMRGVRGGRLGMIFQEPMTSLNAVMSVGEQIAEALRIHQEIRRSQIKTKVVELLEEVSLPDPRRRINDYPHQLSGGMKQRVMVAIALAGNPTLLIADEPTTALDVTIQAEILELLRTLQRDTGMAILLITHDLGVVAEMTDRVGVMYAGQLVEEAPSRQFFNTHQHPYSQKLFQSLPDIAKRNQQLTVIQGSVPRLTQAFAGCRFAPRCEYALPHCHSVEPNWSRTDDQQRVRCHLYDRSANQSLAPSPCEQSRPACQQSRSRVSQQALLKVEQVRVHFPIRKGLLKRTVGQVRAVDGVSLAIHEGHTLALVGESGCGKTTMGKGVLQLIRPTDGAVFFDGMDLTRLTQSALRTRRSDFQIIFQDPYSSLNPRMMVGAIIEEGMIAQGVIGDASRRQKRVVQLLEQVGLSSEARNRYPHEFSGGQRQRICIARALAVNPRLIICDEPTSALDVSVQAQILNLLIELQERLGIAYLFITHDISVVAYLAHEIAVMYLGRIVEQGTVEEVLHHPRHPYTRALLASVPKTKPGKKREFVRLAGDMPSPANPPPGCHFHPRCPKQVPACRSEYPEATAFSKTHFVRCIRAAEVSKIA